MSRLAVVAAGGTGGHLFPAQALAEALIARGWRVVLASDERVEQFAVHFPAEEKIGLSARTFQRGNPFSMLAAAWAIWQGVGQARRAFKRLNPDVVIGFGGYPSAPALVAAILQGRPTIVHEQNAVMGRANKMLAPYVRAVAHAFPTLKKAPAGVAKKARVVGNPVRPEIRALFDKPYEPPTDELRILITGGSQGARLLSELPPKAIERLPERLRLRLSVQQQARKESMDFARRVYADALVKAEVAPFFRDMASRLGAAHLVIGRAGSSSCCEFAVAGKPAILVPLAIALDDDQGQNAKLLEDAGAAAIARESELTVDSLAGALKALLDDPERLARMSAAAKSVAVPDAAERLADYVEEVAGR